MKQHLLRDKTAELAHTAHGGGIKAQYTNAIIKTNTFWRMAT